MTSRYTHGMENFEAEYERIKEIGVGHLIAEQLHFKDHAFRDEYHKRRKKESNERHRLNNKEKINENRRNAYKTKKVKETPTPTPVITPVASPRPVKPSIEIPVEVIETDIEIVKKLYYRYCGTSMKDAHPIIKLLSNRPFNVASLIKSHIFITLHINDIYEMNPKYVLLYYNIFSPIKGYKSSSITNILYQKLIDNNMLEKKQIAPQIVLSIPKVNPDINFDKEELTKVFDSIDDADVIHKVLYGLVFLYNNSFILSKLSTNLKYDIMSEKLKQLIPDIDMPFGKTLTNKRIAQHFASLMKLVYGNPYTIMEVRAKYRDSVAIS